MVFEALNKWLIRLDVVVSFSKLKLSMSAVIIKENNILKWPELKGESDSFK